MEELIRQAIRAKRLLLVCHHHVPHVVEPYALLPTPDETLMLESRLVEWHDARSHPPQWCCMRLAELTTVTLLPQVFLPHPAYQPRVTRWGFAHGAAVQRAARSSGHAAVWRGHHPLAEP